MSERTTRANPPPSASVRVRIPIIVCPECSALEVAAFVGNKTGDVVRYNLGHYVDERGYPHCHLCGAVWSTVHLLPNPEEHNPAELPPKLFAYNHLGMDSGFNPREARDFHHFRRLARRHARAFAFDTVHGRANPRAVKRAADRIYDSEALCSLLDLPSEVKDSIIHHIRHLSENADMRSLCHARHDDGVTRPVRAEAVTIATVKLVMERFGIERSDGVARMLNAFSFQKGPAEISPEEYRAAYHSCAAWFASHLWRDGPEDCVSFADAAYKSRRNQT